MDAETEAGSFGSPGAVVGLRAMPAMEFLPSIRAKSEVQEVPLCSPESCGGRLSMAESWYICPATASGTLSTARSFCDRALDAEVGAILYALGHTCATAGLAELSKLVCKVCDNV